MINAARFLMAILFIVPGLLLIAVAPGLINAMLGIFGDRRHGYLGLLQRIVKEKVRMDAERRAEEKRGGGL